MTYLIIVAAIVFADQLIKHWAAAELVGQGVVSFVPGVLDLCYVENTGAAFSMLTGRRWLLLLISAAAVVLIVVALYSKLFIQSRTGKLLLAPILGGAVGNLIDRLLNGYVVDLFSFSFIKFPVFNLADVCLTCFGIAFGLWLIVQDVKEIRKERAEKIAAALTDTKDEVDG